MPTPLASEVHHHRRQADGAHVRTEATLASLLLRNFGTGADLSHMGCMRIAQIASRRKLRAAIPASRFPGSSSPFSPAHTPLRELLLRRHQPVAMTGPAAPGKHRYPARNGRLSYYCSLDMAEDALLRNSEPEGPQRKREPSVSWRITSSRSGRSVCGRSTYLQHRPSQSKPRDLISAGKLFLHRYTIVAADFPTIVRVCSAL